MSRGESGVDTVSGWNVIQAHGGPITSKTKPMDALNKCAVNKNYIYSYPLFGFLFLSRSRTLSAFAHHTKIEIVMHVARWSALGVVFLLYVLACE